MNRHEFRRIAGKKLLFLDGATGTELVKRGMPPGVCPELWALEHPEAVVAVQRDYMNAGSDIIFAPTFGANPLKLAEFGLRERTAELNAGLPVLSRRAFPGGLVFGDIASTGHLVEPFGDLNFDDCVAAYREQAAALLNGGVDGFVIETMLDLQEARAALLAVREVAPDHPVMVSMTFEPGGRSLTGVDPAAALVTLQELGADAFGCNCSTGPEEMTEIITAIKPYASIPLIAKPNAGMPRLVDDRTVFDLGPEEFAAAAVKLVEAGANLVGGCCGTTPEHISALTSALRNCAVMAPAAQRRGVVASSRRLRRIAPGMPFTIIGERINPTGKKALQAELREGRLDLVRTFAREQEAAGAALLDVNLGLGGIDEAAMMRRAVNELVLTTELPLVIDSTNPAAVEAALRVYPGRALFNSISAETERLKVILPIAAKYGAMLVLLPLTDSGIPASPSERFKVLHEIATECSAYGYTAADWVVDALVMTISAEAEAAVNALDFIAECTRKGFNTVCGLSNVSFGLPGRTGVNLAFLGLAVGRGLSSAIANPLAPGIRDLALASDALLGRDPDLKNYLSAYTAAAVPAVAAPRSEPALAAADGIPVNEKLRQAVIAGDSSGTLEALQAALDGGAVPGELVDLVLIPALTEVGDRFERKEYYLPQLMQSAAAMRSAMSRLEPLLQTGDDASGPVFILATVKGDIHDIGKNIVALLLRNHNFNVIDLGKDVPSEAIVEAAEKHRASFIGLSALMTTTMPRMREVVELLKARGLSIPVFVGGAAVDPVFAAEIGAYYGGDAMATVRQALELLHGTDAVREG